MYFILILACQPHTPTTPYPHTVYPLDTFGSPPYLCTFTPTHAFTCIWVQDCYICYLIPHLYTLPMVYLCTFAI